MRAALADRSSDHLGEERLDRTTHLRAPRRRRREGTPAPGNDELVVATLGLRITAQGVEQRDPGLHPRLERFSRWLADAGRQPASHRLHEVAPSLRRQLFRQLVEERAKHGGIGTGEERLGIPGHFVKRCRLSRPRSAPHALGPHQPVTLERREMSAHGIVRQAEGAGDLLHGARTPAQQSHDPPTRRFEKS